MNCENVGCQLYELKYGSPKPSYIHMSFNLICFFEISSYLCRYRYPTIMISLILDLKRINQT